MEPIQAAVAGASSGAGMAAGAAGDPARDDRPSGLREAAGRETTAGDRISGIEDEGFAGCPAVEPEEGPDPCTDVPIMAQLGLRRGTSIAGAYRIVRPLGAGGMGVVALAYDHRLDRRVAIKFVRPELFERTDLRELFSVEARAMARVAHPNVLAVHAFGEHEGAPFVVMEYVDGRTVEQWLEMHRAPPDIDEALGILGQACRGVEAIHAANTVHRDLKPSNLLIDSALRVAVSDLGVARILDGAGGGDPTCIVGSAAYMAPEAALGEDVKPDLAARRDIYALGCIAYELLTGQPPFTAPTDMALLARHMLDVPPSPSSLRRELPSGFDEVLLRALEKEPQKRWTSVGELRRALERVRADDDVPRRILIADDDAEWRELLRRALAPRFPDAQIDVVCDGEEALAAFDRESYSVALIDLQMPEVDGLAVTERVRAREASHRTSIIVLTAAGGPGEWQRLAKIGADAFLVKPIDPEDVAMLIGRTMRSRRRRPQRT